MPLPTIKSNEVKSINISHLLPDENQIRKTFDESSLKELAADIKKRGIEQPITVRKNGADGYIVKHGERRRRAAIIAGLKQVPVILKTEKRTKNPDLDRLFDQYAENMQREDLNPMDMAFFYKDLRDNFGYKIAEIPKLLKQRGLKELNQKTIGNYIRNTELPPWGQKLIQDGKLAASNGKYILVAMKSEKVLKALEKHFHQKIKINHEDGLKIQTMTRRQICGAILEEFRNQHIDLSDNSEWDRECQPDSAVYYDTEKLSKEDQKNLNIISVPGYNDGESIKIALDNKAHEEINTSYQKRWLEKNKKKAQGSASKEDGEGKESRKGPSQQRLQAYLHQWLKKWVTEYLYDEKNKALYETVQRNIRNWLAFGSPDSINQSQTRNDYSWVSHDDNTDGKDAAIKELKTNDITFFLSYDKDELDLIRPLVDKVIYSMSFENTCKLAHHLNLDILKTFRIDKDYIDMYPKLGIQELAKIKGFAKDKDFLEIEKIKDMREYCLKEAIVKKIACPADIHALYSNGLK